MFVVSEPSASRGISVVRLDAPDEATNTVPLSGIGSRMKPVIVVSRAMAPSSGMPVDSVTLVSEVEVAEAARSKA